MNKQAPRNFGKKGWFLVVAGMFMMFLYATSVNDCLNVVVPAFSERFGWPPPSLYMITTICGVIAVGASLFFSFLDNKLKNQKLLMCIFVAANTICMGLWGLSHTQGAYFACALVNYLSATYYIYYGFPVMLGNWFPKKMGIAMGVATAGANVGSLTTVWLITGCWQLVGFTKGFFLWSIIGMITFVLTIFLKNTPEQAGAYPDNDPSITPAVMEAYRKREKDILESSPFTVGRILKMKTTWGIIFSCGLMVSVLCGIIAQVVPSFMTKGLEQTQAMACMSIIAICAIFFSLFSGWMDTRFSTRTSVLVCGIIICAGLAGFAIPGTAGVVFAVIAIGFLVGTGNNLSLSIIHTRFGRYDGNKANTVIQPFYTALRAISAGIIGTIAASPGGYRLAYIILAIVMLIPIFIMAFMRFDNVGRTDEEIEAQFGKDVIEAAHGEE